MFSDVGIDVYTMRIYDDGRVYVDNGSGRVFLTSISKIYDNLSKDE